MSNTGVCPRYAEHEFDPCIKNCKHSSRQRNRREQKDDQSIWKEHGVCQKQAKDAAGGTHRGIGVAGCSRKQQLCCCCGEHRKKITVEKPSASPNAFEIATEDDKAEHVESNVEESPCTNAYVTSCQIWNCGPNGQSASTSPMLGLTSVSQRKTARLQSTRN